VGYANRHRACACLEPFFGILERVMVEVSCKHDRVFQFEPEQAALLCIDMQRDFLDPRGYSAVRGEDMSVGRTIIPRCRAVLDACRSAGLFIVHTREGHKPDLSDLHEAKQERSTGAGAPIGAAGPLGRLLVRGEYGHDFVDEMQPMPGEPVVDKPGFGAFYATELQEMLRAQGVTHVILLGVTTQCCVFSTLREAVDRGYRCLTLEDCTAAFSESLQRGVFEMIASEGHLFGWITEGATLVEALGATASTQV
jgi:biuret amidohydrolase